MKHTLKIFDLRGDLIHSIPFEYFADALEDFARRVPKAQTYGAEIWTSTNRGPCLQAQYKAGGIDQ